ncbi:MAG: glycosyltransferase family 2 protein [Deltaproteobacteria bacterium]|nr:glycosyltransferase family 2 protein [Deltaproteobacteria bacterium]
MERPVEVSFVMPCLDEAETLAACIRAARGCIDRNGLDAEVVIADNGSTDGSQEIARAEGARVVDIPERGYGAALIGGFEAARGEFLIMGDADMSYDFGEAMPMVEALRAGADLVMGSRFKGRIEPGAMPPLHRWLGNPVLSFLGRFLFKTEISDFHCGLRAFTKKTFRAMNLRTTGMELASEIVVKAATAKLRIAEVPVTLRPDGRSRSPHLRTWRDGWRHLRFLLTLSPRYTLFLPGFALFLAGAALLAALARGPLSVGDAVLDVHTMLVGSLFMIVGFQTITVAFVARIYAVEEEIGPPAPWLEKSFEVFTLERGLLGGLLVTAVGIFLIARLALEWAGGGFGPLDSSVTLRPMVFGSTLAAIGIQTVLMSFVYSMLGIKRRRG